MRSFGPVVVSPVIAPCLGLRITRGERHDYSERIVVTSNLYRDFKPDETPLVSRLAHQRTLMPRFAAANPER